MFKNGIFNFPFIVFRYGLHITLSFLPTINPPLSNIGSIFLCFSLYSLSSLINFFSSFAIFINLFTSGFCGSNLFTPNFFGISFLESHQAEPCCVCLSPYWHWYLYIICYFVIFRFIIF